MFINAKGRLPLPSARVWRRCVERSRSLVSRCREGIGQRVLLRQPAQTVDGRYSQCVKIRYRRDVLRGRPGCLVLDEPTAESWRGGRGLDGHWHHCQCPHQTRLDSHRTQARPRLRSAIMALDARVTHCTAQLNGRTYRKSSWPRPRETKLIRRAAQITCWAYRRTSLERRYFWYEGIRSSLPGRLIRTDPWLARHLLWLAPADPTPTGHGAQSRRARHDGLRRDGRSVCLGWRRC